jgi:hypothetical protein
VIEDRVGPNGIAQATLRRRPIRDGDHRRSRRRDHILTTTVEIGAGAGATSSITVTANPTTSVRTHLEIVATVTDNRGTIADVPSSSARARAPSRLRGPSSGRT